VSLGEALIFDYLMGFFDDVFFKALPSPVCLIESRKERIRLTLVCRCEKPEALDRV
jgi:hypothetical protein